MRPAAGLPPQSDALPASTDAAALQLAQVRAPPGIPPLFAGFFFAAAFFDRTSELFAAAF